MTLNNIKINDEVVIKKVNGEYSLRRRFLDLGIIPDNKIKCVLISPFNDPKAYKINDIVLLIRNNDAREIEVEYERN